MAALRSVHEADGYPTYWPDDAQRWLSPEGTIDAWVGVLDARVVAHVALVAGAHPWDRDSAAAATATTPERLATLSRLFTAPAARGHGLGRELVDAVAEHARGAGLQLILDVVDDGGPAVALYERAGWRRLHERQADWSTPDGVHLPVRVYAALR